MPFDLAGRQINLETHCHMSMLDGKLCALLTGLHAAFSLLCIADKEIANNETSTTPTIKDSEIKMNIFSLFCV